MPIEKAAHKTYWKSWKVKILRGIADVMTKVQGDGGF